LRLLAHQSENVNGRHVPVEDVPANAGHVAASIPLRHAKWLADGSNVLDPALCHIELVVLQVLRRLVAAFASFVASHLQVGSSAMRAGDAG
jgi:hypothetical protein